MENFEYWLKRELLLRAAANYWIVSDPVGPADAVAILGGDPGPRGVAAAEYYRKGLVHKVLISGGHSLISSKPSLARRRLAVEMSVPRTQSKFLEPWHRIHIKKRLH